jgi:hypothetical protein
VGHGHALEHLAIVIGKCIFIHDSLRDINLQVGRFAAGSHPIQTLHAVKPTAAPVFLGGAVQDNVAGGVSPP